MSVLKNLAVMAVIGGMLFSPVAGSVSAQTPQEKRDELRAQYQEKTEQFKETRDEYQEKRQERVTNRCSVATGKITTWTTRYAENRSRFQRVEAKALEIIDAVVARAQEKGKDTSELEAKATEFKAKIAIADGEYATLVDLLNETKGHACGESEGAFKDALSAARNQLQTVRAAIADARGYYLEEVKPAARALLTEGRDANDN